MVFKGFCGEIQYKNKKMTREILVDPLPPVTFGDTVANLPLERHV
jgi:hypothetical protein